MNEAAQSRAREAPFREDLAMAQTDVETFPDERRELELGRARAVARQRLVWENRRFIFRAAMSGFLLSALMALLIPKRFESTARLMPPDQASPGMAMLAAAGGNLGAQLGSGLGSVAGDLLGLKSSSDLFIGILQSRTVQDDLINKFDLKKSMPTAGWRTRAKI
jgi:hypothetical protein